MTDAVTAYGPVSLDEGTECQEKEGLISRLVKMSLKLNKMSFNVASDFGEGQMEVDPCISNQPCTPTTSVESTPKRGLAENKISKSKLKIKCKEIATYTRKDNMNRSCW